MAKVCKLVLPFFERMLLVCLFVFYYASSAQAQNQRWSLDDCVAQALRENVLLNENVENNEINQINYLQSKANLLPNLNFGDAHTLEAGHFISQVSEQYVYQHISTNSLTLNSTMTIFNGFRTINLIKENKINYEAGNLDIAKQENDLMLNVIAAYMQILYEYEAVGISAAIIDVDTEHVDYMEKYVRAGSLSESNLLQAQAQLATDRASNVNDRNQLQLAKVALMQLMEMPVNDTFDVEQADPGDITPDIAESAEALYNIALSFLPEVKSSALKVQSASFGLKISKSEVLPKLTLSGSLTTDYSSAKQLLSYNTTTQTENIGYLQGNTLEPVYGEVSTNTLHTADYPLFRQFNDNYGQSLSLNLSIPIFNNRLYKSDIQRSKVALKVAVLNERYTKDQLRKNIEQAYTDQLAASKNYLATQQQLLSEQRSYHDIEIKFGAGMINSTDFFVEKSNYEKAVFAHLSAKFQYLFKSKIVAFYTGQQITR